MRLAVLAALAAATAIPLSAQAFGIGARAGTTGLGGDVGWRIAPTLSARIGYSALNWNRDFSTDDLRYDGRLELRNASGLIDFHPLGPLFRVTGGVIYTGGSEYDVRTRSDQFTLRGNTYTGASLRGTVEPGRSFAPYLGIGWGRVSGAGVNFYADIGVMFTGSPKARLRASCGTALSAAACAQLRSDVAREEDELEDELDAFKYYPVVNFGLTVGF